MSTIGLEATERLARRAEEAGVAFVDAPVSGTKQPAEQGKLLVLASGPDDVRERVDPVFDAVGSKTVWLGPAGAGQRLKLVLNTWLLGMTEALAEAIALAEGLDVDPRQFLETIDGAPVGAPYAQLKGPMMIEGEFPPAFPLALAAKDAELALAAAKGAGLELAALAAVREQMRQAGDAGHGDEDMAATIHASRPAPGAAVAEPTPAGGARRAPARGPADPRRGPAGARGDLRGTARALRPGRPPGRGVGQRRAADRLGADDLTATGGGADVRAARAARRRACPRRGHGLGLPRGGPRPARRPRVERRAAPRALRARGGDPRRPRGGQRHAAHRGRLARPSGRGALRRRQRRGRDAGHPAGPAGATRGGRPARGTGQRRRSAPRAAAPRAGRRARGAPRAGALRAPRPGGRGRLADRLEPRVGPVLTPDLRARAAVDQHDVGGEVVGAADQRRADPVGVDRHLRRLEGADPLGVEAAGGDDRDVAEAVAVELLADEVDELGVHPVRGARAVPALEREVGEPVRGVQPHAPQARAERLGDLERGAHGVVLEVDEHRDVHLVAEGAAERAGGRDGVATVGGDQRVRHRADSAPTPPRRLRVRRDADRAGDVRRPAVAGLDEPVVVASGEVDDRLAAGGVDDLAHVAHAQRAASQAAEIDRLEVGEQRVVALDRHHRLEGLDLVALVQGGDLELIPAVLPRPVGPAPARALAHHGDRLVDAAEDRRLALEDLHQHARVAVVELERRLGVVEVDVGVVALPDLLDREAEARGGEPLALGDAHRPQ